MTARRSHLARIVLAALVAVPLVGCGSARRGTPTQPPLRLESADAQQGERVFMRFCNGCHPGGAGGLGPALNNKPLPGFAIAFQVRHGLGVMPGFGEAVIPDDDLEALVDYLVALRRHDG